jgi:hypothetical protein
MIEELKRSKGNMNGTEESFDQLRKNAQSRAVAANALEGGRHRSNALK